MSTIYRIITKQSNRLISRNTAFAVHAWMLGKAVSEYIIVKSDAKGDRVVTLLNPDIFNIELVCEDA